MPVFDAFHHGDAWPPTMAALSGAQNEFRGSARLLHSHLSPLLIMMNCYP